MTGFDSSSEIFESIKMNSYVKSVVDNPGEIAKKMILSGD